MDIKVGGFYCHYKAGENANPGDLYTYQVIEISDDYDRILKLSEYTEEDNPRGRGLLVVYEQLSLSEDCPLGKIWTRPLTGEKGFTTPEIIDGREVQRFTFME